MNLAFVGTLLSTVWLFTFSALSTIPLLLVSYTEASISPLPFPFAPLYTLNSVVVLLVNVIRYVSYWPAEWEPSFNVILFIPFPFGPVSPLSPLGPCIPVFPVSPLSPLSPLGPWMPCSPCGPCIPCFPCIPCAPCSPFIPVAPDKSVKYTNSVESFTYNFELSSSSTLEAINTKFPSSTLFLSISISVILG